MDVTSVLLRRGDTLVMCSDGLSGPVDAGEILRIVVEQDDPMEACRLLTEKACENGGDDNITVIVARFEGEGIEPPSETDELVYEKYGFSRVTETTVRTPMPRPPGEERADAAGSPAAATEAGPAAPGPAVAATAAPAERQGPEPAGGPRAADAAPASPAVVPDDDEKPGKSKLGPVLGVLAALVLGGVAAAYFGGVFGSGPPDEARDGALAPAVNPVAVPAKPLPASGQPAVESPPLAPIAVEDLVGATEEPVARERPSAAKKPVAEGSSDEAVEPKPKPPVAEAPEPKEPSKKGEAEETADKPAKKAAKQKSGGSGSGGSDIPDNPF